MIVVVIAGIAAAMALSSFKLPDGKTVEGLTLMTLPQYMRENFPLMDVKLVCFEPCGQCSFLVNGEWDGEPLDLFETNSVDAFSIDREGFTHEAEFAPHDIKDAYKEACFILHKRQNDAIDELALKVDEDVYFYKAAYEGVQGFDSLSALEQAYQKELRTIEDEQ